jgi:hypothetical protein
MKSVVVDDKEFGGVRWRNMYHLECRGMTMDGMDAYAVIQEKIRRACD